MATRTVSPAGGNFIATGTWVGGIAPLAGDDIVCNSSSGNLTLSANTVNLLGANFTGYTGTLALSNRTMLFNAGTTTITLSPTMTITSTTGSGYLDIRRQTTITSNGKSAPWRFNNSGLLITLTDILIIEPTALQQIGLFDGADVYSYETLSSPMAGVRMNPGFKWWFKASTMNLNAGSAIGTGYFVFDNTTLNLNSVINLTTTSIGSTIEFNKSVIWTGNGTTLSGGVRRPNFTLNNSNTNSLTIIMTEYNEFHSLAVATNNPGGTFTFPIKFQVNIFHFYGENGTNTIQGAGGLSASYVYLLTPTNLTLTGAGAGGAITNTQHLKLTSDATHNIGNIISVGLKARVADISSITASVPATVYMGDGAYAFTKITDITNLGTPQYALTTNGNVLSGTTGFISSTSGGGGGEKSSLYIN